MKRHLRHTNHAAGGTQKGGRNLQLSGTGVQGMSHFKLDTYATGLVHDRLCQHITQMAIKP